jgi:phosphomannomutase
MSIVDVTESYLDRVGLLPRGPARELRVALTPMHGVGGSIAVRALRRAGFTDVHLVASQAEPDPDFPTVAFPNPEEPGAVDALLATAAEVDADLAVALDPDADRCALAVRRPGGGWRLLSGDETGALLGDHLLAGGDIGGVPYDDPLVATTVVSSTMLRSIAAAHGARYAETLTGFKWIVRAAEDLAYGYEEALGYCVAPAVTRDKDGITAALVVADLAAALKAQGRTLADRLDDLDVEFGVHRTDQLSIRVDDLSRITSAMAFLRANPPATLLDEKVTFEDLLPDNDILRLRTGAARVVIRPSGTEPKLKAYLEVVEPVIDGDVATARTRAQQAMATLRAETSAALGLQ